jgi:uncharacterized protein (DUF58 family)
VVFLFSGKVDKLNMEKPFRILLKHFAGWTCLLLGMIMLLTPGQGVLTILLGIYLLADEVPFFGRIKASLQKKFPRVAHAAERLKKRLLHPHSEQTEKKGSNK